MAENPFNLRKSTVRYESATLKGEENMKGQWLFLRVGNVIEDFQEEAIIYSRENQAGPTSAKIDPYIWAKHRAKLVKGISPGFMLIVKPFPASR